MSQATSSTAAPPEQAAAFSPANFGLTVFCLCLATFMQVLDHTIANVSLPTIAGNLGASFSQSTWIITSFTVSNAIALPLTGFLTRRFGEVRLFFWATLLFSFTSLLCGMATSMEQLILFRTLQGAVAGPMYPVAQSLLIAVFPPMKRGMAMAVMGLVTVIGPIAGPLLGGWITDNYAWKWIFIINVPIGIAAAFIILRQMRPMIGRVQHIKLDTIGLAALILGVGALQIMLDIGNDADWFASTDVVLLSIVAAVGLIVFVVWELLHDDPIVDLRLFRYRNYRNGSIAFILAYSAFFAINLLVPLWMQRVMGYTSLWAGLATAPIGILPVLLMRFVGQNAGKLDLRWLGTIAFLTMAATSWYRSLYFTELDFYHIAMTQFVMGLGVAFFFMPIMTIFLSDLPPQHIASGAGLTTFLRTLGASFATSTTSFMWEQRAATQHAHLTEHITPYRDVSVQALESMTAFFGDSSRALAALNDTITRQAYQIAFNELFFALTIIFIVLLPIIWTTKPPFVPDGQKH